MIRALLIVAIAATYIPREWLGDLLRWLIHGVFTDD